MLNAICHCFAALAMTRSNKCIKAMAEPGESASVEIHEGG